MISQIFYKYEIHLFGGFHIKNFLFLLSTGSRLSLESFLGTNIMLVPVGSPTKTKTFFQLLHQRYLRLHWCFFSVRSANANAVKHRAIS